jgi:hypothetical protein
VDTRNIQREDALRAPPWSFYVRCWGYALIELFNFWTPSRRPATARTSGFAKIAEATCNDAVQFDGFWPLPITHRSGLGWLRGRILGRLVSTEEEIRYEMDFFQSISGDGFGNPCSFDFSTNAFVWRIREQDEWQRQRVL